MYSRVINWLPDSPSTVKQQCSPSENFSFGFIYFSIIQNHFYTAVKVRLSRFFLRDKVRALNAAAFSKWRSNLDCFWNEAPFKLVTFEPSWNTSRSSSFSAKCIVIPGPIISHIFSYCIVIDHVDKTRDSLPKRTWMSSWISSCWNK